MSCKEYWIRYESKKPDIGSSLTPNVEEERDSNEVKAIKAKIHESYTHTLPGQIATNNKTIPCSADFAKEVALKLSNLVIAN